MKKIFALTVLGLLFAGSALADPMATAGKLVKAQPQQNGLYPCSFTDAEAREFIDFVKAQYEAAGTKLSDAQAAIMAGHKAGVASVLIKQQKKAQ